MTTTPTAPTTAERVRTTCARAQTALIAADGVEPAICPVQQLLPDGRFTLTVSRNSPIATMPTGTPMTIELLDHAPTLESDSVRALVWLHGRKRSLSPDQGFDILDRMAAIDPNPELLDVGWDTTLLALAVDSIVFADATGAETVDLNSFHHAQPDPFCRVESLWLHHLHHQHPEMIHRLRLHLPRRVRRGHIQLVGIDRYGLSVRITAPQQHWDGRIPFPAPVNDDRGLSRALRALIQCPFSNGPKTNGRDAKR